MTVEGISFSTDTFPRSKMYKCRVQSKSKLVEFCSLHTLVPARAISRQRKEARAVAPAAHVQIFVALIERRQLRQFFV
jgi:hypothetical protein